MNKVTKSLSHKALEQLLTELEVRHGEQTLFDVAVRIYIPNDADELVEEYITLSAEIVEDLDGSHVESVNQRDEVYVDGSKTVDTIADLNIVAAIINYDIER